MKKALDYLYSMKKANEDMGTEPITIYEAIKELEDLKSRSCATCKYGHTYFFDEEIECMKLGDEIQGLYVKKDFYCKNWESKWQ